MRLSTYIVHLVLSVVSIGVACFGVALGHGFQAVVCLRACAFCWVTV